ncbi:MAG: branched-chain amino acid ABC transporter permease, partial [Gammaproteobacteria bacterium]
MPADTTMSPASAAALQGPAQEAEGIWGFSRAQLAALGILVAALAIGPFFLYPVFLMKLLCFALFACAFNLLLGYGGLLSFGHAAYFGMASYVSAYT